MKVNAGQAPSTLIPEYIGSDFDKIITIINNLDYIKDAAKVINGIPIKGSVGATPPTEPELGSIWYCTTDGRSYVWYEDTNSGQWVDSSPQSNSL